MKQEYIEFIKQDLPYHMMTALGAILVWEVFFRKFMK